MNPKSKFRHGPLDSPNYLIIRLRLEEVLSDLDPLTATGISGSESFENVGCNNKVILGMKSGITVFKS